MLKTNPEKDKNWIKMGDRERKRAELRIIKDFLTLERREAEYDIKTSLKKAYEYSERMQGVLEDTKVNNLVRIKN